MDGNVFKQRLYLGDLDLSVIDVRVTTTESLFANARNANRHEARTHWAV